MEKKRQEHFKNLPRCTKGLIFPHWPEGVCNPECGECSPSDPPSPEMVCPNWIDFPTKGGMYWLCPFVDGKYISPHIQRIIDYSRPDRGLEAENYGSDSVPVKLYCEEYYPKAKWLFIPRPKFNPHPSPEPPEKVREIIAEYIWDKLSDHDKLWKEVYSTDAGEEMYETTGYLEDADFIILKLQQAGWGNISKQNQMIITLQERIDTVQAEARQQAYKTILDDIEKHCTEYQWTETPDYTKRHYPFCPTDLYELKVKYLGELPKE